MAGANFPNPNQYAGVPLPPHHLNQVGANHTTDAVVPDQDQTYRFLNINFENQPDRDDFDRPIYEATSFDAMQLDTQPQNEGASYSEVFARRLQDLGLIALPASFALTKANLDALLPNLKKQIRNLAADQKEAFNSLTNLTKDSIVFSCARDVDGDNNISELGTLGSICVKYKQLSGIEKEKNGAKIANGTTEFTNLTFNLHVDASDCKVSIGLQRSWGRASSTSMIQAPERVSLGALNSHFHTACRADKLADHIIALIKPPFANTANTHPFLAAFHEINPNQSLLKRQANDEFYASFRSPRSPIDSSVQITAKIEVYPETHA